MQSGNNKNNEQSNEQTGGERKIINENSDSPVIFWRFGQYKRWSANARNIDISTDDEYCSFGAEMCLQPTNK